MRRQQIPQTAKPGPNGAHSQQPASQQLGRAVQEVAGSPGQALDPQVCAELSAQFQYDFRSVRIHTGEQASALNRGLGARGLTVGNHILLDRADYNPGSAAGRELLAHELVHVVQQAAPGTAPMLPAHLKTSSPGDTAEYEARALARQAREGQPVQPTHHAELSVQGAWQRNAPDGTNQILSGAATGAAIGGVVGGVVAGGKGAAAGAAVGGVLGAVAGFLASLFPSFSQIAGDPDVIAKTDAAWASTEAAANATTRREEGFWIRWNQATSKFEFTSTILGPSIGPGQTGSVNLGARPADTNPNTQTAVYTVASFHTHTPTAFRTVGRPIGPSGADHSADTSDDVVGVVYDYKESPAGSGNVPAGHPIGSAAQRYHSGPNRRQRL